MIGRVIGRFCCGWIALAICGVVDGATANTAADHPGPPEDGPTGKVVTAFIDQYCVECHNSEAALAGLAFDTLLTEQWQGQPSSWEKVVRMLRTRRMPPPTSSRPEEGSSERVLTILEAALDSQAAHHPTPGRTNTFRRLSRTEYHHAIRDLLALEVDVEALLPADETSHGFDNGAVGSLSPTLLNRYLKAAREISRLAVGRAEESPGGKTFRLPPDATQEQHVEGLPLGTRGGGVFSYYFPQEGDYEFNIVLARNRNEQVEGLSRPHTLDLLLDLDLVDSFVVQPPAGKSQGAYHADALQHTKVDHHLHSRVRVTAGSHEIGVTFVKQPFSLLETKRQPLNVHFNWYRHPRIGPAIYQVSVAGPFNATGPGNTPSRRRLFVCHPRDSRLAPTSKKATELANEQACAKQILSTFMRRAYRRPVTNADLQVPMRLYQATRTESHFEAGVEMALSSVLINPHFLLRIEPDPVGVAPHTAYRISDVELASRLSFFLWSSIPDDELLDVASRGALSDPEVLEKQTRRMLADERSQALASNFAAQWLTLRKLESSQPDARLFPDFDDNLRKAFRRETELFFGSIIRENRSVLDLLQANYTYLNERLAKHYGVPHIYGSRFRRVTFDSPKQSGETNSDTDEPEARRGGLLRQGSILTVTSYATRTSPVVRGNWILENILGMPTPPPPADVPALEDVTVSRHLSGRQRLAEHRADPACASCHDLIDPIGFSLENYDAVGRWREVDQEQPVDATGGLPDGSRFRGVAGLEQGLLNRPQLFVGTMCEKLLTYALGRGVELFDAPAIREVVRRTADDEYRFSSLIVNIVRSPPFQMRAAQ